MTGRSWNASLRSELAALLLVLQNLWKHHAEAGHEHAVEHLNRIQDALAEHLH